MELLQLRYFVTVAKTLNISRAAQYHMIPQPAMSQTISRLEKELGKPLFDRRKNKLSLTKEGAAFLQSITVSLAELDMALENIQSTDDVLRGELTLLVSNYRSLTVDCIAAFRKKYPEVNFRISLVAEAMDFHSYDFCISVTPPGEQYHQGIPLLTETLQLLLRRDHALAAKEVIHFDDLKNEKFATLDKQRSLTLHLCRQNGFEPNVSMVCDDLHCLTKFVGAGMAVVLSSEMALCDINKDNLVFVPTIPEITQTAYVFENARKSSSLLRQTFLEFLTDFFARQA